MLTSSTTDKRLHIAVIHGQTSLELIMTASAETASPDPAVIHGQGSTDQVIAASEGTATPDPSVIHGPLTSSEEMATPDISLRCAVCNKAEADFPSPFDRCGICKTATYCSRKCKKADYTAHKKICVPPRMPLRLRFRVGGGSPRASTTHNFPTAASDAVPTPGPSAVPGQHSTAKVVAASEDTVDPDPSPTCAGCSKAVTDIPPTLERCGLCKKTYYCSRDCRKADLKAHAKTCTGLSRALKLWRSGALARRYFPTLADGTYLHSFSEQDTFDQLIDSYRVGVGASYVFDGSPALHSEEPKLQSFRRFLDFAESRTGLLPEWWSEEKRAACEELAVDSDHWSNVNRVLNGEDFKKHYNEEFMPIKLRILAEKVYGRRRK